MSRKYDHRITIRLRQSIAKRVIQAASRDQVAAASLLRGIIERSLATPDIAGNTTEASLPYLEQMPRSRNPMCGEQCAEMPLRLPQATLDAVDLAARSAGQSRASYLREYITGYIDPHA
ncbi:MAG: hypothetical protein LKI34_08540 [Bifidobacterium tibiigranuli]|jgi:predicted DNA-binding protein|uniref:hypothetical protein n=1 Tax=Bifidobacterium tibiigranuli TaxID=2172043 RepID=UPI0026EB4720|nr:hypothetical protein [Bifidobacterium tibiigranuli]MCI1674243.1 hypothetical protein [Bifidobacterium tibiigranuli]MCI1713477.1 hypothetical protein [Bifidobacterium tibiigranuli]